MAAPTMAPATNGSSSSDAVTTTVDDLLLSLPESITVTLPRLAKMIDHSLLAPSLTDAEIDAGLDVARRYGVATACVKPYSIPRAVELLKGSDIIPTQTFYYDDGDDKGALIVHLSTTQVSVCPVIGFPAGNSTTQVKVFEAERAVEAGGYEVDMVINVGKALSGDWGYVQNEIRQINDAVVSKGGLLKVIFENDFLKDEHITKLCEICLAVGVAFVKTSTGYGFVKNPENGFYYYNGATIPQLALMRRCCPRGGEGKVRIKAAGGIRTLDELLQVMALGIDRIGASATVAILEEAKKRGIGNESVTVKVKPYVA